VAAFLGLLNQFLFVAYYTGYYGGIASETGLIGLASAEDIAGNWTDFLLLMAALHTAYDRSLSLRYFLAQWGADRQFAKKTIDWTLFAMMSFLALSRIILKASGTNAYFVQKSISEDQYK
jgi:hypothetical protein